MNGQKAFIYKNTLYYIEGTVHTHPPASRYPQGADGASIPDREVANNLKAPNFIIADENSKWRTYSRGTYIQWLYKDFDSNYSISNLYGYK